MARKIIWSFEATEDLKAMEEETLRHYGKRNKGKIDRKLSPNNRLKDKDRAGKCYALLLASNVRRHFAWRLEQ